MSARRIEQAMNRITSAMERIDSARHEVGSSADDTPNAARVVSLINQHEKLREEVADTIGEIDSLIEELEA